MLIKKKKNKYLTIFNGYNNKVNYNKKKVLIWLKSKRESDLSKSFSYLKYIKMKKIGYDLFSREILLNIYRLHIIRLSLGKPVRGQRTRTNRKTALKLNKSILFNFKYKKY